MKKLYNALPYCKVRKNIKELDFGDTFVYNLHKK